MGVLTEYLREEASRRNAAWPARAEAAREWQTALDTIFDQITEWLRTADTDGVLELRRDTVRHYESRLGNCTLPRLTIVYEATEIVLQPRSRYAVSFQVVGGDGTVRPADGLISVLRPEPSGYHLFRLMDDGQARWYIAPGHGTKHKVEYAEFTRGEAEALLVGLLK